MRLYRSLEFWAQFSQTAIDVTKSRLGSSADHVRWIVADITEVELEPRAYDLWHDRAVFHFLTAPEQRATYVRRVARSVRPGGYVIVSAFGLEGPAKCSGLEVMRYDAESLHREFGVRFRPVESFTESHRTNELRNAIEHVNHLLWVESERGMAEPVRLFPQGTGAAAHEEGS